MSSAYSALQITKYLSYLSLPSKYNGYVETPHLFPKDEAALTVLFRCQITRFPFENLSVYYSATRQPDINPDTLYSKMMGAEETGPTGRGGYCLEVNIFFHHMLRGLGFEVYTVGARNRDRVNGVPQGDYGGWVHMANIVSLPTGVRYHLDVGFGGDGPTRPIPLVSGAAIPNLGTQEARLLHDNISKESRRQQKHWIYQCRNAVDKEWNSFYCYPDLEFFQEDFEVINRFAAWEFFKRDSMVTVKFIRSGEEGEILQNQEILVQRPDGPDEVHITGKIMLVNNEVKLNMGGKTKVIETLDTEVARMKALRKWFSICLD
ncbi:N-hydroxyarylamine O-acetyltransferase [Aspergillus arachidicola]|nr:N-hydroxyarylamine O-acetyltransferase [Aspergillus arachidicola]